MGHVISSTDLYIKDFIPSLGSSSTRQEVAYGLPLTFW